MVVLVIMSYVAQGRIFLLVTPILSRSDNVLDDTLL